MTIQGVSRQSTTGSLEDIRGEKMEKEKAPQRELRDDKRLTVRLPDELDRRLRNEANKKGTTINQLMIYILNRHFN